MALQDILQKILQQAKTQVSEIEKEYAAESKQLKKEFDTSEKKLAAELEQKKDAALEKLHSETESMAARNNKQALLTAKNAVIADALKHLVDHLSQLSDEDYGSVLKKLASRIDASSGTVFVPKNRLAISKEVFPKTLTIKEDSALTGGFVFQAEGFEVDNSFSNLIYSEFRAELESFFIQELELLS